jgi:hypothetical protein
MYYDIELEVAAEDEEDDPVFLWRFEQLEHAGYDTCSAAMIAARPEIDLHDAVTIVRRGCPPLTAVRILS